VAPFLISRGKKPSDSPRDNRRALRRRHDQGGQWWEPAGNRSEPEVPTRRTRARLCARTSPVSGRRGRNARRSPVPLVVTKRGGVRRPPRRCPRLHLARPGGGDRPTPPPPESGLPCTARTIVPRPPRRGAHPAGRRHLVSFCAATQRLPLDFSDWTQKTAPKPKLRGRATGGTGTERGDLSPSSAFRRRTSAVGVSGRLQCVYGGPPGRRLWMVPPYSITPDLPVSRQE
jgi:hypothetical protein